MGNREGQVAPACSRAADENDIALVGAMKVPVASSGLRNSWPESIPLAGGNV
jgi:hypothetical protein